jgi:hypothetical protein
MTCALIRNSIVVAIQNLEEAEIQAIANQYEAIVDITDFNPQPKVSWQLIGSRLVDPNGTAIASIRITKLAMRQRFTVTEMLGMMAAANTVPIVQYLMDNLTVATYIDLNRPDTIAGINLLVSLSLISQSRATAILTTPPTIEEVYKS